MSGKCISFFSKDNFKDKADAHTIKVLIRLNGSVAHDDDGSRPEGNIGIDFIYRFSSIAVNILAYGCHCFYLPVKR